ncbi:MAG: hypothetical protein Q8O67_05035 [Deltaproteobacteria bacterium]|nr:hypothetical protein [Deltaproteobacteria bacterium]
MRTVLDKEVARDWARRVIEADAVLVDDFGGEQRALGRAFYTHVGSDRAPQYFGDARRSDDVVEGVLPGMQAFTRGLLARLLGGVVRQRHGFCGPGVHVFPAGEKVAERGGVFHFDLEGLTDVHFQSDARAVSFVVMLQPGKKRGGLTLFSRRYRGENWPMDEEPKGPQTTTTARAGDALLFSSLRLHRINGFSGEHARISITCHAVEVDDDVWDCWF